jgi:hypothetical protein
LDELRSMVVAPLENAPIAIGGTPIGDHYTLPTQMVELVLKDLRWKPTSLGCNLPLSSMSQAIQDYRPRVFWLIVSHIDNAETLIADYRQLHGLFSGRCEFILCGKGITPALLSQMPCAAYCQSFQQIVDYVQRRFGV